MKQQFGRVVTAMVTPFDDNGNVNYNEAQKLAKHLIRNGSDSILVAGTTGESPTLSKDEKIALFKVVKEAVGTDVNVIAGTGSNNTMDSVKMTIEAERAGVDGILAVVPYYNKPSEDGLYEHFKLIAENTKLPIMLYNIPSRCGKNMLPDTVVKLSEIENIVAIKEAAGDIEQMSILKSKLHKDFLIYSGDDALTLPLLSLGAYGIVSVAAHIVGNKIQEMIEAFLNGENNKALDIHLSLLELFKSLFITTNPIPVKTALNLQGFKLGGFRLPLVKANDKEIAAISNCLNKYKLI